MFWHVRASVSHNRPSSRRTLNSHHDLWKLSFHQFRWEKNLNHHCQHFLYISVSVFNLRIYSELSNLNKILFLPRFLSLVACDNGHVFKGPIMLFSKPYSPYFDLYYSAVFLSCILKKMNTCTLSRTKELGLNLYRFIWGLLTLQDNWGNMVKYTNFAMFFSFW